ncbi:MAG: non-ribosomal peptide synthetase, partial [Planctomycetaceae bacterium]|nr:non-ribosomal peptide synthetase [Planctomycetaceae bacterium]
ERLRFELPLQLSEQIKSLAGQTSSTLFSTVLAAVQAVLFRYSGQYDFCIGSTVTNRDRPETRDLIGLFVNSIVFRCRPTAELTFLQLLEQTHRTVVDGLRHQHVPFEQVVDALQIERQLSHNPLFQVMFLLRTDTSGGSDDDKNAMPLQLEALEPTHVASRFDLSIDITETSQGLQGFIEYSTDLFQKPTIKRLAEHLQCFLQTITDAPTAMIGDVSLLTSAEQQQIQTWNQTSISIPELCAHQLFELQAAKTPDAIAITFDGTFWTYRELDERANQLANYLLHRGCQSETPVALCLERGFRLVASLLAILKAGAYYVPLDPSHPAQRNQEVLDDAEVALVIVDDQTALDNFGNRVASTNIKPIVWSDCETQIVSQPTTCPDLPFDFLPDRLAYQIYTSGSTGKPKGVPITQKSLVNLLTSVALQPGVCQQDVFLALTTIAFDIATLELLLPLTVGAQIVLTSQSSAAEGQTLLDLLSSHRVTVAQATPATWRLLCEALSSSTSSPETARPLLGLKALCGGEALDLALARQLLEAGVELWNMYGPTETTIWSGVLRIDQAMLERGYVPIGGPIANTGFHVLDQRHAQVPIGVAGELYISGAGLSPGYHGRPALTKEKFIALNKNGTPSISTKRLYATGDRVRHRDDGTLEFLGRQDHQIKLRGFRIELGEIESHLTAIDAVDAAFVMLQQVAYEPQLIAYCQLVDEAAHQNSEGIRKHLQTRLPAYMIPADFVLLDQFPLSPNGKVDRQALQALGDTSVVVHTENEVKHEPLDSAELGLARIWEEVLGRPVMRKGANFFEQGGHSLLAARMIAHLRDHFQVDLPLRAVFDSPKLEDLARKITEHQTLAKKAGHPSGEVVLSHATRQEDELFLTHAQQRQWVLAQLDPSSPAYNIPAAVKIDGELDYDRLEESVATVCQRHEVLRTAYVNDGTGSPRPELRPSAVPSIQQFDLSDLSESEQELPLNALLTEKSRIPFDLEQAPLLRVICVKLSATEHVVMLVLHHIVADAWSLHLLFKELRLFQELPKLGSRSQRGSLIPLTHQYSDYARLEQQNDNQQSQDYWKNQLADVPDRLELPIDYARPAAPAYVADSVSFQVNPEQKRALEDLSRQHQATLFMTLLAAFKVLLARYTGNSDIVVGSPVGHRPSRELENVVGLFVNTLAYRTTIENEQTFVETLGRVRETVLGGLEYQDVPFEQVLSLLQTERDWQGSPVFQVMFLWQHGMNLTGGSHDGLQFTPYQLPISTTKCDLTLTMSEDGDTLSGRFEFRKDLFHNSTIRSLSIAFQTLIDSITANPLQSVNRLNLLGNEHRLRLQELNKSEAASPSTACLHQLFEQQASLTPTARAVVHAEGELSYEELDKHSDQLAERLQQLGVGPETRVGVCLSRTPNLVTAIFGILKAGGAYVPIDPNYPPARIQFLLDDSEAAIVVSEQQYHQLVADGRTIVNLPALHNTNWQPELEQGETKKRIQQEEMEIGDASPLFLPIQKNTYAANAAYLIYTSGSTGRPKGVTIEHRNAVAMVDWARQVYSPYQLRGVLASTSVCFDLSIFELFVPLSTGGAVVLAENALEIEKVAPEVTLINTVPSVAAELVRNEAIPPNVCTMNIAGEPLGKQLVDQLYMAMSDSSRTASNLAVHNLYGPSEDTTYSTFGRMVTGELGTSSPIGKPVSGTRAYVLDAQLSEVPPGMPGELYLAGDGVARGYWGRPGLTAEAFLPNPFQRTGQPIYKTGDRVRLRQDGQLEFLGRIDNQIKLRGFRIELGEIEQALLANPEIQQAAVVLIPSSTASRAQSQSLTAYIVRDDMARERPDTQPRTLPPADATTESYRQWLAERLPRAMIPGVFVEVGQLPLLPNGKINREALPAPEDFGTKSVLAPATNDLQQALLSIWSELLGRDEIGIHDNFFALGGDSITVLQIVARAQRDGLPLKPRDLFQHPTISALAAVIDMTAAPAIPDDSITEPTNIPLSPIQQWFFTLPLDHPEHWNQSILLKVDVKLQTSALAEALRLLAENHPALRATFAKASTGAWQQTIQAPPEVAPLTVIRRATGDIAESIHTTAAKIQSSFQLDQGPLWHVVYYELTQGTETARRLLVVCHHLVVDGVSWRILLADLQLLYQQLTQTGHAEILPEATSFRQWVTHLESSADFSAEREYWQAVERQFAETSLPQDYPTGKNSSALAGSVRIHFSAEQTGQLFEVPSQYPVRVEELLVTALSRTLTRWTGHRAASLQLEGHGRIDLDRKFDLSRTVGWLTSLYPVVVSATHNEDLPEAINKTKESFRNVPQGGVGYGRTTAGSSSTSSGGHQRYDLTPETRFNYLGQADQLFGKDALFSSASEPTGAARHPEDERDVLFDINAIINEKQLVVYWIYGSQLHSQGTMRTLTEQFREELLALVDYCLRAEQNAGYSEADFPQMDFHPGELDQLLRGLE